MSGDRTCVGVSSRMQVWCVVADGWNRNGEGGAVRAGEEPDSFF